MATEIAAPIEGLKQSRVGKLSVTIPKGVTVQIANGAMTVKGPKGELARPLPPNVDVKIDAGILKVMPTIGGRDGARFQGLTRALLNTMVKGVSESYVRTLELKGTGYRAEVKGPILNLALGFSHPVNFPIPKGVTVQIPADSKGTMIILTGSDKAVMGQTAATIRGFRPPEPYGGKGVRYQGEKVRQKAGKSAGKGK